MSQPAGTGQVESFDPLIVQKYCETLVEGDEPERALLVLDNLPAYYRDFPPQNLVELRADILASLITAHGYMSAGLDSDVRPEQAASILSVQPRGKVLIEEMHQWPKELGSPLIIDCGPGEYFVPIGLKSMGFEFTYKDIGMDRFAREAAFPHFADRFANYGNAMSPTIFVCWEIIEHLSDPTELAMEALKHNNGLWPDVIHCSTPMYCYDGHKKNWRGKNGQPHRRAYTPSEFHVELNRIFPGYRWQFFPAAAMVYRGVRNDKLICELKVEN